MSSISERIMVAISKAKLSYSELSELTNIPKAALQRYATGTTPKVPLDRLEAIAKATNVSAQYLMGWGEKYEKRVNGVRIPVLGYVAAGIPIEAITDVLDYEELSPEMVKDGSEYFALQIKGSSMEPKISEGDVVIVRKQEDCENGQIAIVCVNGDQATCKRVMKQANGILLQPLNPAYEPTFYTAEQIQNLPITILGRVVELRAKF